MYGLFGGTFLWNGKDTCVSAYRMAIFPWLWFDKNKNDNNDGRYVVSNI